MVALLSEIKWTQIADLPAPMFANVAVQDKIYVYGGHVHT